MHLGCGEIEVTDSGMSMNWWSLGRIDCLSRFEMHWKGHRVGGFRQDIEESMTQLDGDLQALQRLGLEQAQVDQMLTAVQHISQADAQDEGWMDMSAHIKRFLGVIGIGVSP
jgi:hypothetical protein